MPKTGIDIGYSSPVESE